MSGPKIILVRHGETEWNRLGIFQGTADISMNDRGRAQVRELARALRGRSFDVVYSSPLERARETAEAIVAGREIEGRGVEVQELEVRVAPELTELSYGLWQGRGAEACSRCNPGLEWRFRNDPWRVQFPGGERLGEVRDRVRAFLGRVRGEHPEEAILVSGHGHLNRVLMIEALGWPESSFWEIEQKNGGYSVLEPKGEGWILDQV